MKAHYFLWEGQDIVPANNSVIGSNIRDRVSTINSQGYDDIRRFPNSSESGIVGDAVGQTHVVTEPTRYLKLGYPTRQHVDNN